MHVSNPPSWRYGALAGLFVLLFLAQSYSASRIKSPTADEPYHIAAGLSYVAKGRIQVNPQHPPVLKELSGLSLRLAGIRWPNTAQANAVLAGTEDLAPVVGGMVIMDQGIERTMFWARLPLLLVSAMLGVLLFLWGRSIVGPLAAVCAVFLFAFDPTFLAHSYLVTTDCGLATFTVLFLFSLWLYIQRPDRVRLLLCGVCLGAALTAKFSAVALLPVAAALLLGAVVFPPRSAAEKPAPATEARSQAPRSSGGGRKKDAPRRWRALVGAAGAFAAMCVVAAAVVELVYLLPDNPLAYLAGMQKVNADHQAGYMMYMAGELEPHFSSYYLVAWLLKAPAALILLVAAGCWYAMKLPAINKVFLIVPAIALFAGYSLFSDNIGVRYIIPVLPFVYLIGGAGLAGLLKSGTAAPRVAAAALSAWLMVAAAGIYPDHLSYFNEMACALENPRLIGWDGGTRCGPAWLDDSNVDWGQGLAQLKHWLDAHAKGRKIKLGYLGSFPPWAYGIDYDLVHPEQLLPEPAPGLYVISAHLVAGVPALAAKNRYALRAGWLRQNPTAIVGHCYYVFDIRPATR